MRKFRLVMTLAGGMAIAAGLTGCVDENPWGHASKEQGTIDLTLTADYGFDTTRPVFRSDDDTRAQGDENDLSTYITLPEVNEFKISLNSKDGSSSKSWESLTAFKEDITKGKTFTTGIYTITASYGDKSEQGFEKPYFEASSTFTVIANRESKINLTAELQNSMIAIDYTDEFKAYMSEYKASLASQGSTIEFSSTEERPAFITPGDADITMSFTTKETHQSSDVSFGTIAAVAKTMHKVTFGVKENENGWAKLTVTFSDDVDGTTTLDVDLTDDLYTTPAPEITPVGFENNTTYDWNTRKSADGKELTGFKMNVLARGGISEANFGVVGATTQWGTESIDLHATSAATLAGYGIKASNFDSTEKPALAILDFEGLMQKLAANKGTYTLYLNIKDTYGQTCDQVSVTINSEDVTIAMAKEDGESLTPDIAYASNQATVTLDFNGNEPENVKFQTASGLEARVVSCEGTRAFDTNRYTYTLELPQNASISSSVNLKALYGGSNIGSFSIPVKVPEYAISDVDAFAHHAYLKVTTPNSSDLDAIMTNLELRLNGSKYAIAEKAKDKDNKYIVLTVNGLTSSENTGTNYEVSSSITGGDNWANAKFSGNTNVFTTEKELKVPNGDFETLAETINTTIDQGGKWTQTKAPTAAEYQTTLTMQINEPADWYSSNTTTCNLSATNVNTWFVIPSVFNTSLTWLSNQPKAKVGSIGQSAHTTTAAIYQNLYSHSGSNAMVIRNVAWDLNGTVPGVDKKTGEGDYSNYYCSKEPTSFANRTAGFLRLGTASKNGVDFKSRPSILNGYYKYTPDTKDTNEKGVVTVKILCGTEVIGSGELELGTKDTYTQFSVPITYTSKTYFGKNVTTLQINITSSNKTNGITTTNYCNKDECCSRGAMLTVDNLTFEY